MTYQSPHSPEIKYQPWETNDAPLFIILGQSNSYGHGTQLPPNERITQGLNNVFTLSLPDVYHINVPAINWVKLTSFGNANIGAPIGLQRGNQDHPYNAANRFAKFWQDHISQGNALNLPDLYVILMGFGGQGMYLNNPPDNRWAPERDPNDAESLYPRAIRTLRMAVQSLRKIGKNPRILAVHWNQWEAETESLAAAKAAEMNFTRIITGVSDAIGSRHIPWRLYYPLSVSFDPLNTSYVNEATEDVIAVDPNHRTLMDARNSPNYTGIASEYGVFLPDEMHYDGATQTWFAQQEWELILSGYKGVKV
ncbi:hypothetical protein ABLA30_09835 [Xenorhabdus nematophila]|uniref:Sialate O-acetylesterase domain-containing protein n=1 Tax=Xenorhabdus nematophila (strain ATCC 19061 / DSM 3370 / CCUG 14189 / LMG 1036 / NCIMB 9965 / AN6) TaxID=406817 RepID=D3VCC0_XENNA|nr:hypothetical protein [Xenorhabdus nematophila]CEE92062.1 conserved hypothetical protein [Xenorhabdus nematophila str. Anatoliense]CBJ89773.1 conserved hypothetical protein [Xenorhabdus nematophila ATCC 19061]CCW30993.1 conserved hypothetical protein [Xenorhabdus nematophila F1]CEE95828.1 conserved hypothetical protein [Xenorhabdus nematophila str. Anatoliense]CEK22657.1 conserved hypothetical protein [Xenorhabdus nematophila AN6/1]